METKITTEVFRPPMGKSGYSIYVHPWDVADEGVDNVLGYLKSSGIGQINLATTYHAGRFILPHNPSKRVYSPEDGVSYFNFDSEYFEETLIKPVKSSDYPELDVIEKVCESARNFGIKVSAWTVLGHNGKLAEKYPEFASVDPYGTLSKNYLCPGSSQVTEYMKALLLNLSGSYEISSVQMEALSYPNGMAHGNHHEVFGVPVHPVASYLYSMCYCGKCVEKSRNLGIDLDALKPKVRKAIDEKLNSYSANGIGPEGEGQVDQDIVDMGLGDIIEIKRQFTEERFEQIRDSLAENHSKTDLEIVSNSEFYHNEGYNFMNFPDGLYALNLTFYFPEVERITKHFKKARESVDDGVKLNACIRTTWPMTTGKDQIREVIERLTSLGASNINFYNYGWSTAKNLGDIAEAISDVS